MKQQQGYVLLLTLIFLQLFAYISISGLDNLRMLLKLSQDKSIYVRQEYHAYIFLKHLALNIQDLNECQQPYICKQDKKQYFIKPLAVQYCDNAETLKQRYDRLILNVPSNHISLQQTVLRQYNCPDGRLTNIVLLDWQSR